MKTYNSNTDDWEEEGSLEQLRESMMKENKKQKKEKGGGGNPNAPQPIVYTDLVGAFCEEFAPCSFIEDSDVVFTFGKLRDYFSATVPFGNPDALPTIVSYLKTSGFNLVSYLGEPAILAKRKAVPDAEVFDEETGEIILQSDADSEADRWLSL